MKKLSIVLLAVLLVASLIISCDNSTKALTDGLVEVRIGTDSGSRGLNATVDLNDEAGLEWHYSASKVTENQFKYGETSDTVLTGTVTLSMGKWDFGLWALKDGKRVYSGTVTGVLITKTSDGSPTPVVVPVSPYTGENGTIKLTGITIHAKTDGETPVLVTPNYAKIDNTEIAGFNGTADAIEVATGSHSVTVAYKGTDGVTYASETIYVTVYSGRETLVTGFVSEETGSADISHKSTVAIVGIDGGVKNDTETIVSVAVTPSMGSDDNTKVTFPVGSFTNTEAANAVLTVNVKPIDSPFSASAAGSSTPVAGLDIALLVNDQPVTQFNDKSVTIETYIAKGLENVKVYYNGTASEVKDIPNYTDDSQWTTEGSITGYSKDSGKLVFTTKHFSEFYVGSDIYNLYNTKYGKVYLDLQKALDESRDKDVIKVCRDFSVNSDVSLEGKSIILDLNHKTISYSNNTGTYRLFWIKEGASLEIINTIDNSIDNGGIIIDDQHTSIKGLFDVYGILILNGGYYESYSSSGMGGIVNVYRNGELIINNSKIVCNGMDAAIAATKAKLTINGGYYSTNSNSNVSNFYHCIKMFEGCTAVINDGEFHGVHGAISIGGGKLVINNVKAYAEDRETGKSFYALYVAGTHEPVEVVINGGEFKSDNNKHSIFVGNSNDGGGGYTAKVVIHDCTALSTIFADHNNPEYGYGELSVMGGTFSTDPSEYLADGYCAVAQGDKWIVQEAPVVIGTKGYATLKDAFDNANDGDTITVVKDVVLTETITLLKNITLTGDGKATISGQPVYVGSEANVTFKNVNFATPDNTNGNASSVYAIGLKGKVVFDGCKFTNPQWECIQITPMDGAEIVVKNCTFIADGNAIYAHDTKVERLLHIQNTKATGKYKATITNNRFIGVDLCRNSVIDIDDIEAFANVTCGGNSFAKHEGNAVSTLDDGMIYININDKYDAANVATNTYAQFTQTPAAALHH